jgi:hypothetical protein
MCRNIIDHKLLREVIVDKIYEIHLHKQYKHYSIDIIFKPYKIKW